DRKWAKMFSDRPKGGDDVESEGVDPQEFQIYFVKQGRFTAGMGTHYRPSIICGESVYQHLAEGYVIGTRFHSAPVMRLGDARLGHLGQAARADGRWRVYAFADAENPASAASHIRVLCEFLAQSPDSAVRKFTPAGQDIDAVIDVRAVFQQGHAELDFAAM